MFRTQSRPNTAFFRTEAKLLALEGRHPEAQRLITDSLAQATRTGAITHLTYSAAQVFALGGKSADAARWLQETLACL